MILTELLGSAVVDADGAELGRVADVRFVLDGPVEGTLAAPRLVGLIVSPHTAESFDGYERTGNPRPVLLARFFRWRMRGAFLVLWGDLARISGGRVILRQGGRRYSPILP